MVSSKPHKWIQNRMLEQPDKKIGVAQACGPLKGVLLKDKLSVWQVTKNLSGERKNRNKTCILGYKKK